MKDTLGDDVRVEIQNSLNKGLYTEIKTKEPVTEEQVQAVENRMRELVDADLPFIKTVVDRDEAIRIIKEDGRTEKLRLLE